jgi:hypothetical protein
LRRLLTPLLFVLAAVLLLLEATIWRWLNALGALLARLPLFAALERLVQRLSPNAVVAVFVLPFVPIIPLLKLGELWLIQRHHYVLAAVVIIGAKVVGAAFSTRVFAIAKPKLLQVRWFARAHAWVTSLVAAGHRVLEGLPAWVALRAAVHRLKQRLQAAWLRIRQPGWLGRRLRAAQRRLRRSA